MEKKDNEMKAKKWRKYGEQRKKRGEEEEEKKNVNNLWVYEQQHVPYACTSDCCLFVCLSHRCYQMTKYRIRIQAQIHESQELEYHWYTLFKNKNKSLSFRSVRGHESYCHIDFLQLLEPMKEESKETQMFHSSARNCSNVRQKNGMLVS